MRGRLLCLHDWLTDWLKDTPSDSPGRQQTDVDTVPLFCLVVGLSAVDENSGVSLHRLGTSLHHPSSTGSHWRVDEAFLLTNEDTCIPLRIRAIRMPIYIHTHTYINIYPLWHTQTHDTLPLYHENPIEIHTLHTHVVQRSISERWSPMSCWGASRVVRPACVALYASLGSQTALIQIWTSY